MDRNWTMRKAGAGPAHGAVSPPRRANGGNPTKATRGRGPGADISNPSCGRAAVPSKEAPTRQDSRTSRSIRGRAIIAPAPLITACVAVALGRPSLAADPLPEAAVSAVLSHAEAFVAAVNDSSNAAWRQAVNTIYAASTREKIGEERLVAQLEGLHREYAPLEFHHGEVGASALHVFARSVGAAGWKDFQFYVDPQAPHGLLQLVFVADTAEPVHLPNGSIRSPETVDWLHHYVEKLMTEEGLSGRMLLAQGERTFYQRAFGHLDAAGSVPMTGATRFGLASGGKMFTAVAILMLVEEEKIGLDQPIGKFLPEFPDAALGRKITVRQLLTHSSGLGDFLRLYWEEGGEATTLRDVEPFVYRQLSEQGIAFEPGTQHQYSNSGFLLLGRIVEEASGQDFYDFVRTRIFAPLGMTDTGWGASGDPVPDLAPALTRAPGHEDDRAATGGRDGAPAARWIESKIEGKGTSAGGGYSTPPDMFRFMRGLASGKLVSPTTLAEMTRPQLPGADDGAGGYADGFAYGLGLQLERSRDGVVSWGHGGIAPGVNFSARYFPGEEITLVLCNNQDSGAYDALLRSTVRLITGER